MRQVTWRGTVRTMPSVPQRPERLWGEQQATDNAISCANLRVWRTAELRHTAGGTLIGRESQRGREHACARSYSFGFRCSRGASVSEQNSSICVLLQVLGALCRRIADIPAVRAALPGRSRSILHAGLTNDFDCLRWCSRIRVENTVPTLVVVLCSVDLSGVSLDHGCDVADEHRAVCGGARFANWSW